MLIVSVNLTIFWNDFATFMPQDDHISMQILVNESLWCLSTTFINVIFSGIPQPWKRSLHGKIKAEIGKNCDFKHLEDLMINFCSFFIKTFEVYHILSFGTTFVIVESFWNDLVPKKMIYLAFRPQFKFLLKHIFAN